MAETTRTKKTTLACDSCRRRKRKCDGRTPVCSLCEKSNYECVYDATLDQRRPVQKNYVAALEARVALLESVLRDAGASDVVDSSGLASLEMGDPTPQATRAASPAPPPIAPTQPAPEPAPEPEPAFVPSDDAVQALTSFTRPSPEEATSTGPEEIDLGMSGYVPLVNLEMEHKLLAQFWDWQRMHMPYVAPVPMLAAYALHAQVSHPGEPIPPPPPPPPPNPFSGPSAIEVPKAESVQATPETAQYISPLLLDAMFAIAALFHGNLETSNQFYTRAESRVFPEAANPRLATVQAILLMATAELGHARAPAAWTLDGVAVALCVRLGMNVDASPLVRRGVMSKTLFETRNFVFWSTYNIDRFHGICMGMQPLMDRRIISTPRHSSLAAANVVESVKSEPDTPLAGPSNIQAEKPTASDVGTTWWSPVTLGMGDVIIQAGWEAIRDLCRMSDMLLDGIYAFDAPKRTPQEDLELVTRNNLIIQRFLDDLPTWLRSTGVIRRKDNGLVYLHIFVHLTSILTCRPFLSPRPLSEDAMRLDATTDISQPTHSSHIIRRYRTLAFRVARASALQVTSLIRHIPLSSPCVTIPYVVYSACTILLLAPDDPAAMDGVRTGVACLESMDETGYWVNSAKDARVRIQALARRWGVNVGQGKKVLGPIIRGGGGGGGGESGPGTGGAGTGSGSGSGSGPSATGPKDTGAGGHQPSGSSGGAGPASGSGSGTGSTGVARPATSTAKHEEKAKPDTTHDQGYSEPTQQYEGRPGQVYADQGYSEGAVAASNQGYTAPLPQGYDSALALASHYATALQNYDMQTQLGDWHAHATGLVRPADEPIGGRTYGSHGDYSTQTHPGVTDYTPQTQYGSQTQYGEGYAGGSQQHGYQRHQSQYPQQYHQLPDKQQLQNQYQPLAQYQPQQHHVHPPTVHHHVHVHQHYHQHQHVPSFPEPLPHVAYAQSHAEPQHDTHLPHTHWHQVLPPADPNLPFPLDPIACTDIAVCFADTIQTAPEPAFVQSMEDPYVGVPGISANPGGGLHPPGGRAGQSYSYGRPAHGFGGAGYMSGYGQGMQ